MTPRQEYMKEYNKVYRQSYKGFIKHVYSHQLRNCRERQHLNPSYSEEELLSWYISNPKHLALHQAWINSDCSKELTPSIDRLDNSKTYSFDNIEVVTWLENQVRARVAVQDKSLPNSGLFGNGHVSIVQYDLNGNKVAEYISIAEASRNTGIDHRKISTVCKAKSGTYKNYFWAYLEDETNLTDKFTPQFLETTKAQIKAGQGFKVAVEYLDGSIKVLTVKELATLLETSCYIIRQTLKGKSSTTLPLDTYGIKNMYLKD